MIAHAQWTMDMLGLWSARAALGLVCGTILGIAHFGSLRRNVAWLVEGRAIEAMLMQAARFAVLALVLFFLARAGAVPLLGAALGLMAGRRLVLQWLARRP